jgi:putative ABC transport system permease protein
MSESRERAMLAARESFGQAFHTIRGRRMRSALLIVGVAIGVATLLAIFTIVSGLSERIRNDIVSAGRPYLNVARYVGAGGEDVEALLRRPQIQPECINAVRDLPGVDRIDYLISNNDGTVLHYEKERTNFVQVFGSSENLPYMFSFTLEDGRYFTPAEVAARARVCVLGAGPRKDLFPRQDPIGKTLNLYGRPYLIVGAMEARKQIMGQFGDNFVNVPWTSFEKDFARKDFEDRSLLATVAAGWETEAVRADVIGALRKVRRLAPGEANDFEVTASETYGELVDQITQGVALVLVVLSSIGLMVGGIGVMNIMLISVTERTREIGVRMAIGARRQDLLLQVLVEAGTLTGIGGVIGIGLGYLLSWGTTKVLAFPFAISPWVTAGAVLFSVAIGVVFGVYPANRAARMDPVEALRYE